MKIVSLVHWLLSYYKRFRKRYWAWCYFNKKNVTVHGPIKVLRKDRVKVGENCTFNEGVLIDPGEGVSIGNNVVVSSNTMLLGSDLNMNSIEHSSSKRDHETGRIVIGDNVWLGAGSIVLKNCSIGSGSVVGAGSVVTKDIPGNSVAVGNPAEVVKKLI